MKKILLVLVFVCSLCISFAQRVKIDDCQVTKNYGFQTYTFTAMGNVYLETDPKEPVELRVRIVTNPGYADFCIFKTTDTPKKCGEWKFVKNRSEAKFAIRYVKDGEDCTICFVSDRNKAGWKKIIH